MHESPAQAEQAIERLARVWIVGHPAPRERGVEMPEHLARFAARDLVGTPLVPTLPALASARFATVLLAASCSHSAFGFSGSTPVKTTPPSRATRTSATGVASTSASEYRLVNK